MTAMARIRLRPVDVFAFESFGRKLSGGGPVKWVSLEFEDGSRVERARVIREIDVEIPAEFAGKQISTVNVLLDQR